MMIKPHSGLFVSHTTNLQGEVTSIDSVQTPVTGSSSQSKTHRKFIKSRVKRS